MNRFTGVILALSLGAVVGACASSGAGGSGSGGIRPRDTRLTRDAEQKIALAMLRSSDEEKRALYEQALESAKQAIQEDSANPQGYFVAGQAYANLDDFENADLAWDKAEELYPPFATELMSERENAWVRAYNLAIGELQADNLDGAIRYMELADAIYQGRPEARMQLGFLYAQRNETDKAISAYRGALDILRGTPPFEMDEAMKADWASNEEMVVSNLAHLLTSAGRDSEAEELYREILTTDPQNVRARVGLAEVLVKQGRTEEAEQLYNELLSGADLSYNHYLMIGVAMFQAEQYERSAYAFRQAVRVNPYSRDGYYNLAQALFMYADELEDQRQAASGAQARELGQQIGAAYEELATSAEKVLELDPFNRNIIAYMARAYQALHEMASDNATKDQFRKKIQEALDRHEGAELEIMDISITPSDTEVTLTGRLLNLKVAEGAPIRLRFNMLDTAGTVIGSNEVSVSAPAANATTDFRVTVQINGELAGWSYARIQ